MRRFGFILLTVMALGMLADPAHAYFRDSAYIPDIETFMQIGANYAPRVSRDAAVRCFESRMSGVTQLYRLGETGWPVQLTFFPDGIDFSSLSHDGRWAIVGAAIGGSEETNLYLVEVATGRSEALTDVKGAQIADPLWSFDDTRIYYRTNQTVPEDFHLHELALGTRAVRPVLVQTGFNVPQAISQDGSRLAAGWYPTNSNGNLFLINLADTSTVLLTPHEGDALYQAVGFSADGRSLYILTDATPDGMTQRAVIDLDTRALALLDPDRKWEVDEFVISEDGQRMAWVINEDGWGHLKLYDVAGKRELPSPPLDGVISAVSFSGPDAVVFSFVGPADPPDCWRWDYRMGKLEQWTFAAGAGIDRRLFVRPQLVRFPSFDGLEISGFLYLPPGAKKGDRVPFIVNAHGGPESQFRPTFVRNVQYFLLNGFGYFALNPRGSFGYGREFLNLDNYKNRWKSVKDYETAVRWLGREGYADSAKIAITGASYGGFMTLAAMTTNPELYAAGIDEVGIANFVTFLRNTAPYRRALRESEYGPLSDSVFLLSISPLTKVDNIRAPLLIAHGANDPRVPPEEARQMARAIAARGGAVDTLFFANEGHSVQKRANLMILYRRIVDFLNQHLR